ncbi:Rossmann fold nucleotide-binding protein Smf possibly involved in DNA uptake [uncultured Rubrobacteraceae bacterium]|uniref:Rossmann fold nucleotide-binding protein Smf possibly involved in DNA uptake n=1 Tax=uncultured Rubrobacteraceae bacterium TaxID=349277 RepID=A0A6J4Q543_9ACTN|nr:Rossmann fold nucleotide-binding protein Smf possibly involved in DNA uptake [uncultured Rubrobacteraceae bacterium]
MRVEPRVAYLFLSLLQARVGASVISRLGELDPANVLALPTAEVAARARLTEKGRRAFEELKESFDPATILARLEEKGIRVVTFADEGYPSALAEIPDPPPALFVDGEVPRGLTVALVGSRKALATGIEAARTLGRALGERGVCVASGLALGIDAAAHEGAVEAGGPTIGVLGCGIDIVYPRSNRLLFGRVKSGGGIISEYYLGEAPLQWRFPARNRIIAGLSDVVVVVEAPEKSGALITARHALEAGRDVWAVPGPFAFAECRGSNALLADGAGVLWDLDRFVEIVAPEAALQRLPVAQDVAYGAEQVPAELPEKEAAALAGVGFEPAGVDVVARRVADFAGGVEMRDLLSALALLELKGYVTRDASGAFVRNRIGGPSGNPGGMRW